MEKKIGGYQVLRSLGKGGMGEVFLVKDPLCSRTVALKQIRADLAEKKMMQARFLREARIAAQLTHPSIVPILEISEEGGKSFYTMPYVEGETLKQILRQARDREREGKPPHPIGGSIPALMRIFLSVCQAIAYTHSKGILHRDLKPENIIVGKYGEVMLLDWGIADFVERPAREGDEEPCATSFKELTHPGKIAGTITYIPPERALGEPTTWQLDLYALGVTLYQILTLKMPFQRTTLQEFRKRLKHEELLDPSEAAPYRDIPLKLAQIAKKCLAPKKEERYASVTELIGAIERFISGSPEWTLAATLSPSRKEDWEFQEHVLLAKHIAITRATDVMEWVSLMISKRSFSGNLKIEIALKLGSASRGIGVLFNFSQPDVRNSIEEGYCLWATPSLKLFRSGVEVAQAEHIEIPKEVWQNLVIEKSNSHIHVSLNSALVFSYSSQIPVAGTHIGLLFRDGEYEIEALRVYGSSQNLMVSCLAVPDTLLAYEQYEEALTEYRRIGTSFRGRAEGREALFRAGVTLLEKAKRNPKKRPLYSLALEEFGKLHATPSAPLEYLGKSLVYKACNETEEESKCLELALRKYPKHPLLPMLIEQIIFRLHESSLHDRTAAYHFALLAIRYLPTIFANPEHERLLFSLTKHLEPLPFVAASEHALTTALAFWLAKPKVLETLLEKDRENALFCLLELGCYKQIEGHPETAIALLCHKRGAKRALQKLSSARGKEFFHLCRYALDNQSAALLLPLLATCPPSEEALFYKIWALLQLREWHKAGALLHALPEEKLHADGSPFYPLYGCFLAATSGREKATAHFVVENTLTSPPTTALLAYALQGKIDRKKLLFWERLQLYRQLALFYHCNQESDRVKFFLNKVKREVARVSS